MKKYLPLLFLCWIFVFKPYSASVAAVHSANRMHEEAMEFSAPSPDSIFDQVDLAVSNAFGCARVGYNTQAGILLENNSMNTARFLSLVITYDTTAAFLSCNYPYTSMGGGTLLIQFDSMPANERKYITLEFAIPPLISLLNHNLIIRSEVTNILYDFHPENNKDSAGVKIRGSFDPNTKSVVPEGFGIPHYVPVTQEEFKYTIDFQNTGTDTAINITLTDTLSAYLDPLTIKAGAASHPYSWEILAPGILKFHFNGINLPDSSTNEPRSHGFVSYSIKAVQGLHVGTVIKNTAHVFFDFNPPVATNTTTNELFSCDSIAFFSLSQNVLCGGDQVLLTQTSIVPHLSQWYVDSVWQAAGDSFVFHAMNKGMQQIILLAQTPYCDQIVSQPVNVIIPAKPLIIQNAYTLNTLPAQSYQWLLNGLLLPGAQAIAYQVSQAGWYQVQITDGNGCSALSDSVYVSDVGIDSQSSWDQITVGPNPVDREITIRLNPEEEVMIQLFDCQGKQIDFRKVGAGLQEVKMSISENRHGVFAVLVSGRTKQVSRILIR